MTAMITVKEVIEILQKYPPGACIRVYEGEMIGIVIEECEETTHKNGGVWREELGFIETKSL